MMRNTLLLAMVAWAALLGVARAEEESAIDVASGADSGVGMAGYTTASNVENHALIDKDIRDIIAAGNDWETAKDTYANGKFSPSGDAYRSIKGMSTGVEGSSKEQEPYYKLGQAFWGRWDYGDAHMTAALDGTDVEPFGKYDTNAKAHSDAARKQMVKKLAAFTLLRDYAVHELESAMNKYKDTSKGEERFLPSGAVHAWDEWWAFYVGSLEDGSNEADEEDDEGKGYGPYTLGEKFAAYFGTDGKIIGNGGGSHVNWELLFATTAGKRMLQKEGFEEALVPVTKCIRAITVVPGIQGCLRYGYRASSADETKDADVPKLQAEAYAFCSSVLPFLHAVDDKAANDLHETVRIDSSGRPDWATMKAAFSAKNLNAMGIRCKDIGSLKVGHPDSMHEECTDRTITNEEFDASACNSIVMPSSSASLRMGMMTLVASLLSLLALLM